MDEHRNGRSLSGGERNTEHLAIASEIDGHSEFQIRNFIVAQHGATNFGKYKQCCREIARREKNIRLLEIEEAELLEFRAPWYWLLTQRGCRLAKLAEEKNKLRIFDLRQTIATTKKELRTFVAIADDLRKKLGDMNADALAENDDREWIATLKKMAQIDVLCSLGVISRPIAEKLLCIDAADATDVWSAVLDAIDAVRGQSWPSGRGPYLEQLFAGQLLAKNCAENGERKNQ